MNEIKRRSKVKLSNHTNLFFIFSVPEENPRIEENIEDDLINKDKEDNDNLKGIQAIEKYIRE